MRRLLMLAMIAAVALSSSTVARAQTEEEEEKKRSWSNAAELSLVVTEGNSSTSTLGFKNTYRKFWGGEKRRFQLKLEGVQSEKSDDRFALLDPNGDRVDEDGNRYVLVEPSRESDVERYLAEGRYDQKFTEKMTWNAGLSWDRNADAGIINRYQAWAGVANIWWDRDDLKFNTAYGLSWVDRQEENPPPDRDEQFGAFRFNWHYMNKFGKATKYINDWTVNSNLSKPEDYWFDMTNSVVVSMTKTVALSISLQWLFNAEPSQEEIDLIAIVPNPDPPPDSAEVIFGSVLETKKRLDTTFSTSLVINF